MPLYDYHCDACGDFEAWRKLTELNTPMVCPHCQSAVRRLFSPPNIVLNSGRFPQQSRASKEPRLVKRKTREPSSPRSQSSSGSRPWMIGHAPERL